MTVKALDEYAGTILTLLGILAIVVPVWLKWGRPRWKHLRTDVTASRDALVGRDAIVDPVSGTQIAPPLPGIGKRMETIETALIVLVDNQTQLKDHAARIGKLELGAVERIAARVETGQAYGAMAAAFRSSPESNADRDHREGREDQDDAREDRRDARADRDYDRANPPELDQP